MTNRSPNPYRGLFFGAFAGTAGAWVMLKFQSLLNEATQTRHKQSNSALDEDASMKAADRIASSIHCRPLSAKERDKAGTVLHYALGATGGAMYGLTAEYSDKVCAGFGMIFGTLLFALADELALPLAGLSRKPSEYPPSSHLRALASHILYGASTEAVRSALCRLGEASK